MRDRVRSNLARVHDLSDDLPSIAVPADPNGLAYDRNDDTLYIADGGGAVLAFEQGRRRRIRDDRRRGLRRQPARRHHGGSRRYALRRAARPRPRRSDLPDRE